MQKKENFFLVFISLLLLSIAIAFISKQQVFQGITGIVELAMTPFRRVIFNGFHAVAATDEGSIIKELRDENAKLRLQLVAQKSLQEDNAALHDQFATTSHNP